MTPDPQQAAVINAPAFISFTDAQNVVMSGPGSGKTFTAVSRVRHLTAEARKVVVLTFTNSAAQEFSHRIGTYHVSLGNIAADYRPQFVGTLHAYCFRLCRKYAHLLGYVHGNLSILPEDERDTLLKQIRDMLGFKMGLDKIRATRDDALTKQIWDEYRFTLRRNHLVDYDMILEDAKTLLGIAEVREAMAIDDLVVDEAQDSALIDWEIYRLIPAKMRTYFGDVDQCVFQFRGAQPHLLMEAALKAGAKVFLLENNYRSDVSICEAANSLISHNQDRWRKQTRPIDPTRLGRVIAEKFDNDWDEMESLAARLRGMSRTAAVLCRTNYQADKIHGYLWQQGIQCYKPNEYRRRPPEFKRLTILLGIMIAPRNEMLAEQYFLLDRPAIEVTGWKLKVTAAGDYLSDHLPKERFTTCTEILNGDVLTFLAKNGISQTTIDWVANRMTALPEDATLADLLHSLYDDPYSDSRAPQPPNTVYVGTMHSAKGREFDVVFLPAFEELDMKDAVPIEEERRLAFVAITRARHDVYISWADSRRPQWGQVQHRRPSRFIKEMEATTNYAETVNYL